MPGTVAQISLHFNTHILYKNNISFFYQTKIKLINLEFCFKHKVGDFIAKPKHHIPHPVFITDVRFALSPEGEVCPSLFSETLSKLHIFFILDRMSCAE